MTKKLIICLIISFAIFFYGKVAYAGIEGSSTLSINPIIYEYVDLGVKAIIPHKDNATTELLNNGYKFIYSDKIEYKLYPSDIQKYDIVNGWTQVELTASFTKIIKTPKNIFSEILEIKPLYAQTIYGDTDGGGEYESAGWSTARNAVNAMYDWSAGDNTLVRGTVAGNYYIDRSEVWFDSNELANSGYYVSDAYITIKTVPGQSVNGTSTITSYFGNVAMTTTSGYNQCGTTTMAEFQPVASSTNSITLNQAGKDYINFIGDTKFCFRSYADFNNITPTTNPTDRYYFYKSNRTGTNEDPTLNITLTASPTPAVVILSTTTPRTEAENTEIMTWLVAGIAIFGLFDFSRRYFAKNIPQ